LADKSEAELRELLRQVPAAELRRLKKVDVKMETLANAPTYEYD
jgi:hypothetical protein